MDIHALVTCKYIYIDKKLKRYASNGSYESGSDVHKRNKSLREEGYLKLCENILKLLIFVH